MKKRREKPKEPRKRTATQKASRAMKARWSRIQRQLPQDERESLKQWALGDVEGKKWLERKI